MSQPLINLTFTNATAENLGDAFGIPLERQNELGQALDRMVEVFTPTHGTQKVYVSQVMTYMKDFCNSNEEFIYCLMNHIAWCHRTGRAIPPK